MLPGSCLTLDRRRPRKGKTISSFFAHIHSLSSSIHPNSENRLVRPLATKKYRCIYAPCLPTAGDKTKEKTILAEVFNPFFLERWLIGLRMNNKQFDDDLRCRLPILAAAKMQVEGTSENQDDRKSSSMNLLLKKQFQLKIYFPERAEYELFAILCSKRNTFKLKPIICNIMF